jgi:hypothetical protein
MKYAFIRTITHIKLMEMVYLSLSKYGDETAQQLVLYKILKEEKVMLLILIDFL